MRRKYLLVKIKKNRDDDGHISLHLRAKDREMILDMFGNYHYTVSVQEMATIWLLNKRDIQSYTKRGVGLIYLT